MRKLQRDSFNRYCEQDTGNLYTIPAICARGGLRETADQLLGQYQAGFRSNRSTADQVFTLQQVIANSYEHNLPLHLLFIDFKQVYNSINQSQLYKILREFNIPDKLVRLI